ncbi:MAG: hypothetical protein JXB00_17450 [Bacteroidales bacterium]|nr:hypothetical protein [Bacteroidales bacterium]
MGIPIIGTPISDEERTSIRNGTDHLLMVSNAYKGPQELSVSMDYTLGLLKQHANTLLLNREIITT